jgi:hypothetical protein
VVNSSSPVAQQLLVDQGFLIIKAERSHPDTPHSEGIPRTSDHCDAETSTWQHTTLTRDIHAPGRIRTHSPSNWAAADLRLRQRGHWDRLRGKGLGELLRLQKFNSTGFRFLINVSEKLNTLNHKQ